MAGLIRTCGGERELVEEIEGEGRAAEGPSSFSCRRTWFPLAAILEHEFHMVHSSCRSGKAAACCQGCVAMTTVASAYRGNGQGGQGIREMGALRIQCPPPPPLWRKNEGHLEGLSLVPVLNPCVCEKVLALGGARQCSQDGLVHPLQGFQLLRGAAGGTSRGWCQLVARVALVLLGGGGEGEKGRRQDGIHRLPQGHGSSPGVDCLVLQLSDCELYQVLCCCQSLLPRPLVLKGRRRIAPVNESADGWQGVYALEGRSLLIWDRKLLWGERGAYIDQVKAPEAAGHPLANVLCMAQQPLRHLHGSWSRLMIRGNKVRQRGRHQAWAWQQA